MTHKTLQAGRRRFFQQGGLALGTALAGGTAATWTLASDDVGAELARLQQQLAMLENQQALTQLAEMLILLMQQGDASSLSELLAPEATIRFHGERRPADQSSLTWLKRYFSPERPGPRLSAFLPEHTSPTDIMHGLAGGHYGLRLTGSLCLSTPATGHSSCEAMARSLGLAASETQSKAEFRLDASRYKTGWLIEHLELSTIT